jgi:hypothetical protein
VSRPAAVSFGFYEPAAGKSAGSIPAAWKFSYANPMANDEKESIDLLRTALQTWLGPELSSLNERLKFVEKRLDGIGERLNGIDKRLELRIKKQLETQGKRIDGFDRNEMRSEFATVDVEIRHLQQITDMRERLASVEAKLAAQHG